MWNCIRSITILSWFPQRKMFTLRQKAVKLCCEKLLWERNDQWAVQKLKSQSWEEERECLSASVNIQACWQGVCCDWRGQGDCWLYCLFLAQLLLKMFAVFVCSCYPCRVKNRNSNNCQCPYLILLLCDHKTEGSVGQSCLGTFIFIFIF